MKSKFTVAVIATLLLSACGQSKQNTGNQTDIASLCAEVDGLSCSSIRAASVLMKDQFERKSVFDDGFATDPFFGWLKIINDFGKVIVGAASNFVDVTIFDDQVMGPAAVGDRALYFYGREGYSVHNVYFISQTHDIDQLVKGNVAVIRFDYLPIDLEANEFLKLEVCEGTPESCGTTSNSTVAALNSANWKTVWQNAASENGQGPNGKNHTPGDWKRANVVVYLKPEQAKKFIFRFNARMDDGFVANTVSKGMEDGVGLDNVSVTAVRIDDQVD